MGVEVVVAVAAGIAAMISAAVGSARRTRLRGLAAAAEGYDDDLDDEGWVPDGPSDQPGYDTQHLRPLPPMRIVGWPVRSGERRHRQLRRDDRGRSEVVDEVVFGYVALHAADLPRGAARPWRLPPPADTRPAARLVRALWSDLAVHLDDRVEVRLPEPPAQVPAAAVRAGLRLVAGVRALQLDEDALVGWLADRDAHPEPAGGNRAAREAQAWRATQLLTWFVEHPAARAVALREREAPEPELRVRAALLLDEAEPLLTLSASAPLPEGLQRRALARGLELALAQGDYAAVNAALADADRVRRWPEVVVPPLLEAPATAARPCLFRLLSVLAPTPQFGRPLLARVLRLCAADGSLPRPLFMEVLLQGDQGLRAQLLQWTDQHHGQAESAALCLDTLARYAHDTLAGEAGFDDEAAACWLLTAAGARGGPDHLAALRPWADAVTAEGKPAAAIRAAAADAARNLTARLPAGLLGGLSMVEVEAGALSVAAPPKAEDH